MATLRVLDRPYPPKNEQHARDFQVEIAKSFTQEQLIRAQCTSFAKSIIKKCADNTPVENIKSYISRAAARMETPNGELPALTDTAEFFGHDPPPEPEQIISHLLKPGTKMLLGGASKAWKTWTLMDINISVACGAPWWGFPTRQGKVCYINLELQSEDFERRFRKICEVKRIQTARGMFQVWNLRGYAKQMKDLVRTILPELEKQRFSLVTIDPVYKTLPPFKGSENDSSIITQLLNQAELIAIETGASVVFASHFSKGNQATKDSMDRVAGSGAWARDADTLLTMTQHENYDCLTVEASLRSLPRIRPFVVQWDYPLFIRQDELDPDKLKKKGGRPAKDPQPLLDHLSVDEGKEPGKIVAYMKKHHDWSRATVYRIKDQLIDSGDAKIENELWYRLSK